MKKRHPRNLINSQKSQSWYDQVHEHESGLDHKPWLTLHDVPLWKVRIRTRRFKTKRVHRLLSMLEYRYFLALEQRTSN